jgi:glycosyltransferase involved in cell wall biosynthesis
LRAYLKRFDILHFHDESDLSFPLSLSRLKKPRLFSCHSLPYLVDFYAHHTLARRLFTTSADLFHVFSGVDARNLRRLGVQQERIRVAPHGIDVSLFDPKKTARDSVRIVWFGRIERSKGLIVLLKAFQLLEKEPQKVELVIGGKIWDVDCYRELARYRSAMNLNNISFSGFVADLPSFLQKADIFALPSLQETFGIVNLEAMASGLPIVASSVGGVPEVVADNETGFLVPPGDPVKLAEKLRLLITDRELRRDMGRRGRQRVESLYSIDKMAASVLRMYREFV